MSAASFWNTLIWTNFAQPASERALYRRVLKLRPERIVEFGLGDLTRTQRVIALAARRQTHRIAYCGIDAFDARVGQPSLKLKQAHQRLWRSSAKVRLVPGDLLAAVGRTANLLIGTDLLIIDACYSQDQLDQLASLLPRMFHEKSLIARFEAGTFKPGLVWWTPDEIGRPRRAAA